MTSLFGHDRVPLFKNGPEPSQLAGISGAAAWRTGYVAGRFTGLAAGSDRRAVVGFNHWLDSSIAPCCRGPGNERAICACYGSGRDPMPVPVVAFCRHSRADSAAALDTAAVIAGRFSPGEAGSDPAR